MSAWTVCCTNGKTYSKILSERLARKQQPFNEAEIRTWLSDLLPVLDYIHRQHIIHRDISLDNIMFGKQKAKPILIDFGVVKEKFTQFFAVESSQQQIRGSVVGKVGYSPPEQLRMGYSYPCSDIYALGVCTIVLLTGKAPFMLIDSSLEWHWESYIKLSDSLTRILRKMLAEKPTKRYQSAKEILAELQPSNININTFSTIQQVNNSKVNNQFNAPIIKNLEKLTKLPEEQYEIKGEDKNISKLDIQETVSFNKKFIQYCQQELTSFVGPFANVLIQRTLESAPTIPPSEFIEVLTKAIPHPERAKEFKIRLQSSLSHHSITSEHSNDVYEDFASKPTTFGAKFLEDCRRELTSFVGPFATIIIDETLHNNPDLTAEELIEILITQIPDSERAENFKERIKSFY